MEYIGIYLKCKEIYVKFEKVFMIINVDVISKV